MTNPGRLGEGRTTKALAWVIDVGWVAKVSLWLARYKDQACGPMSLSEAKAAARAMVRGEPADYTVTNPIAHLHGLQSSLLT
jgi:hypothetical protein